MFDDRQGFLSRAFLQRAWALDYEAWRGSEEEAAVTLRLRRWADRPDLKERSAQSPFVQTFFVDTWGYAQAGRGGDWTAQDEYPVAGAGAGGASGSADLALGWFGEGPRSVPQVLCEFKDIRSDLDAPQPRKGNTRSPVRQCLDYVAGARRAVAPNAPIQPWWGLVSDMNEVRLYAWERSADTYLRFVIRSRTPLVEGSLTDDTEDARFDRFVFAQVFARDRLLSRGGRPELLRLVDRQGGRERELEGQFYQDYRGVRERLFSELRQRNPAYADRPARLLRLAQKIMDRFIFAFYCEDMGARLSFEPDLIKDLLVQRSQEALFDPDDDDIWVQFKRLFRLMDRGGPYRGGQMRRFNGGLFLEDPEIDGLRLPNRVFCLAGQGYNEASIQRHRDTLLHLCAGYNYAARGAASESISLYTLGRIFEQSITELEVREAELEARPSLNAVAKRKLPKRKGEGVYYTPEWVVARLTAMVLDPWFEAAKRAAGWADDAEPGPEAAAALQRYHDRVAGVRVVDPACGSGAFLIGAFRRLLRERKAIEAQRARVDPTAERAVEAALTAAILDRNLHGVDISGAAVEIAKLALWLHSARPDAPLSSLDEAILCGNSLVGPDFYAGEQHDGLSPRERERVNAFDWTERFPFEGEAPGRFDVVLGNPPYVKLQNLRKVDPEVADHLAAARPGGFESTRTGNFDLYLPFIEQGLRLLRPGGRMGYIAPSLWTVNEYGEGLRRLVRRDRRLERWVDFKSHQIFDEAITYTALQVFTAEPNAAVQVIPASGGEPDVAAAGQDTPARALSYDRLAQDGAWLLATGEERDLIDRLAQSCLRLDDPSLTTHIFQGLITSADSIYHLRRLGAGRYLHTPGDGDKAAGRPPTPPYEVAVEDALMKPLVSGPEAKRYEEPRTDTYLLFPYARDAEGRMRLIGEAVLRASFPKGWAYLETYEAALRGREGDAFDDAEWWRFGRSQNIDKQDRTKLIVAQTVPELRVSRDSSADKYLNNVRVNGILAVDEDAEGLVFGALNGPVADFVFRRIGKPKMGGWFEANKQFIAPLPIPKAEPGIQAQVGEAARRLQHLHTERRDLAAAAADRLAVLHRAQMSELWLWPDLTPLSDLQARAPGRFGPAKRKAWAEERHEEELATRRAAFAAAVARGGRLEPVFADGELRLLDAGEPVLSRLYLEADHGPLVEAYWRWVLLDGAARDAAALEKALLRPPSRPDAGATAAAAQFRERVARLAEAAHAIDAAERAMNARLADLYALTPEERELVARG